MEQVIYLLFGLWAFLAGASIFSFLNVVIYRTPRGISFVKGRSFCPGCGHELSFLDMIPVAGWFLLKGRCRYCKAKVSFRYPAVETLGGILALVCLREGIRAEAFLEFCFFALLTAVALVDWDTMEIPNGFVAFLGVLGLLSIFLEKEPSLGARLLGMVCVSLPMGIVTGVIPGAFGGGDIKLMAACGLFLGWKKTLLSFFFAVLGGGGYGIWLLLTKKKKGGDHFAFGPFLCAGMLLAQVWGEEILAWYLGLFGLV